MRWTQAPCVALLALAACAGSGSSTTSGFALESAATVLTLRTGTVQELRERRGQGPFRTYALEPDALLDVVERAAAKARGRGGHPVAAIFKSRIAGEVVAKERGEEEAASKRYTPRWLSAMVAMVNPIPGQPGRSRLEIHATHAGPFHRGIVDWERDLPRWIDETIAEGPQSSDEGPPAIKPIP